MGADVRRGLLFLLLCLPLLSISCSGGCEDSSSGPESSQSAPATGGPAKGSGDVNLSFYDTAEPHGQEERAAGETPRRSKAPASNRRVYPMRELEPSGFSLALSAQEDVLMMVSPPACTPCEIARPVLDKLAAESGDMRFYRLSAANGKGFLPGEMETGPYPGFVFYRGGRVLSLRKGLPLERKGVGEGMAVEPVEAYQARLEDWFRWALKQRRLGSR